MFSKFKEKTNNQSRHLIYLTYKFQVNTQTQYDHNWMPLY